MSAALEDLIRAARVKCARGHEYRCDASYDFVPRHPCNCGHTELQEAVDAVMADHSKIVKKILSIPPRP